MAVPWYHDSAALKIPSLDFKKYVSLSADLFLEKLKSKIKEGPFF